MKNYRTIYILSGLLVMGFGLPSLAHANKSKVSGKEESRLIRKKVKKSSTENGAPAAETREESVSNKDSSTEKKEAQSADERARLSGEQSSPASDRL